MDVSIIIPNFNDAFYLEKTLRSIERQTVAPREVLVIDDASTDHTLDVVKKFPFVRLLQNPQNLGVNRTLNRGYQEARGKWILSGSSNDLLLPRCIELHQENVRDFPNISLSLAARVDFIDGNPDGECLVAGFPRQPLFGAKSIPLFQSHPFAAYTAASMMERAALLREGGLDLSLDSLADWYLIYKLLFTVESAYTPEPATAIRFQRNRYSDILADPKRRGPLYLQFMNKISLQPTLFQKGLKDSALLFELDGIGHTLLLTHYWPWVIPLIERQERKAHDLFRLPFQGIDGHEKDPSR